MPAHDRLAVFGMLADLARQREQPERAVEIDILGRPCPSAGRRASASRSSRSAFAELHVGTEAAAAQRHFEAGRRDPRRASWCRSRRRRRPARELAGVAAFRIVRAADEGAELAELQRQAGRCRSSGRRADRCRRRAAGTDAAPAARRARRSPAEILQLLDLVDRADEVAPEVAQHVAPGDLVVGDAGRAAPRGRR